MDNIELEVTEVTEAVEEVVEETNKIEIEPLFEEMVDFDTFSKSDFRVVKVKECFAVPKSKKLLQFTLDDGTDTDMGTLLRSGLRCRKSSEDNNEGEIYYSNYCCNCSTCCGDFFYL